MFGSSVQGEPGINPWFALSCARMMLALAGALVPHDHRSTDLQPRWCVKYDELCTRTGTGLHDELVKAVTVESKGRNSLKQ